MNGNALFVSSVDDCGRFFFELPGTVNGAHSTDCEFDSLRIGFDASLADPDLPRCIQSYQLVIAVSMTMLDSDQTRRLSAHRVQALRSRRVFQFAPENVRRQLRVFVINIISDVVHEPLEAFAVQSLLHRQLFTDVAHVEISCHRLARVEIFFVLIVKPSLNDALVVYRDQRSLLLLRQLSEVVRHETAVNVADSAAGNLGKL